VNAVAEFLNNTNKIDSVLFVCFDVENYQLVKLKLTNLSGPD
jgi:O-acetyl-ADP-ribose deacetylase (regulator of RNase III)